jgi:hypothetical protein
LENDDQRLQKMSRRTFLLIGGAAALLLGVVAFIADRFFRRGPMLMFVSTVDGQGRQVGATQMVLIPSPDHVPADGLSRLDSYVARLVASNTGSSSLIVSTPNQQIGLLLMRTGNQVTVGANVEWRSEPQKERAIRTYFQKQGLKPSQDYLAGNGSVPDSTRVLSYPVGSRQKQVSDLCGDLLRQVYGVNEHDPLDYLYEDHR